MGGPTNHGRSGFRLPEGLSALKVQGAHDASGVAHEDDAVSLGRGAEDGGRVAPLPQDLPALRVYGMQIGGVRPAGAAEDHTVRVACRGDETAGVHGCGVGLGYLAFPGKVSPGRQGIVCGVLVAQADKGLAVLGWIRSGAPAKSRSPPLNSCGW